MEGLAMRLSPFLTPLPLLGPPTGPHAVTPPPPHTVGENPEPSHWPDRVGRINGPRQGPNGSVIVRFIRVCCLEKLIVHLEIRQMKLCCGAGRLGDLLPTRQGCPESLTHPSEPETWPWEGV